MMGMSIQNLQAEAKTGARRQVLNELALEAVAAAEKLKVTAAERKAELEKLAKDYNMEVEQVKAAVPEEDLNRDLLLKKAGELVLENAKEGKAPAKKAAPKKAEEKPAAQKAPAKKPAAKKAPAKKAAPKTEE